VLVMRIVRPVAATAAVLAGLLAVSSPSIAEESFPPRVERACGGDARRLCPSDRPGTPGMRYCMQAKQNYFSASCKRALEDSGIAPRGHFTRR